ncbi:hypothetical protein FQR65_LT17293 [Abscondita terminalis]|nr:hypothetical protein FQR65_LT17293 [Abscondita terminalis]
MLEINGFGYNGVLYLKYFKQFKTYCESEQIETDSTLLEARRKTRKFEDDRNSTSEEEYRRLRKPKSNFSSININLTPAATEYFNSPSPASSGVCSEEGTYFYATLPYQYQFL